MAATEEVWLPREVLSFRDIGDGVYLQSRQNADLFNVAHFRAKTKTTRILMRELQFADDSALVAHSAEEMQKIVDAFSDASKKLGLKINIKKIEVLYQTDYKEPERRISWLMETS